MFPKWNSQIDYRTVERHSLAAMYCARLHQPQRNLPPSELDAVRDFLHWNAREYDMLIIV
jgi:hypothetical protein